MISIAKQRIHNAEDKLVKCLASNYGQEFLDYLEALYKENADKFIPLPCMKIKHKEPTEIITPDFKALYMDFAYEMEDESITHYEHFSGDLTERKLAHTESYVFEKYRQDLKKVNTIIVSTGDPKKSKREIWAGKIVKFNPIWMIFLKETNGREKLKNIENKVKIKKELTLFEAIDLVFMVLFDHDEPPEEIIEKVCYLVSQITNPTPDQRKILHWGLTLIIFRFIKDPEQINRLKGMVKMYDKTIHDTMHDILEHEKQEAVTENKIEIAKNMIKEGFPTNLITKLTRLDLNSVKKLQLEK